jgi:hypothetical protein
MLSRRLIGLVGVLTVLLGLASTAYAQSDQIIYADSLGAGWQDWSWCARDLSSTEFVHNGSRSVKVTYIRKSISLAILRQHSNNDQNSSCFK